MGRQYDFELLLVRHGDAHAHHPDGDAARELTDEGRAALARCVPAWRHFGWGWSAALHSPLIRARQTSEIFWEALAPEQRAREKTDLLPPSEDALLVPGAAPHETARRLCEVGNHQSAPRPLVAAFGHNPNLSRVASLFLTGDLDGRISLGRGDIVHLFVPAPSPFDLILDPQEEEPLPRANLLGFYPRAALELIRPPQ